MKRRGLRLTLVLGFVVAVAGAGYAIWALEARGVSARAAQARPTTRKPTARRPRSSICASGLEAYVAAGQRVDFWAPRVATALEGFKSAVGDMQRLAPGPEPAAALESATDLAQLDARARDLIGSDQALVASDLVFSDGLEMLRAAGAHVAAARTATDAAAETALRELARQQACIAAAALGVALLVVLLLLPSGAAPAAAEPAASGTGLRLSAPAAPGDMDAELAAALDAGLSGVPPTPRASEPPAAPVVVDLAVAAELCGDLGRLTDSAALPGLLERTAAPARREGHHRSGWRIPPARCSIRPPRTATRRRRWPASAACAETTPTPRRSRSGPRRCRR